MEASVEDFVDVEAFGKASVEASVEVTSATTSYFRGISVEAFVEVTSMEAFAKYSVEASGILFPWKLPYLTWKLSR